MNKKIWEIIGYILHLIVCLFFVITGVLLTTEIYKPSTTLTKEMLVGYSMINLGLILLILWADLYKEILKNKN